MSHNHMNEVPGCKYNKKSRKNMTIFKYIIHMLKNI